MKKQILSLFILAILCANTFGEGLSPVEKQIAATAKNSTEEAVALLERVVNINSGTMNHEGVEEVGRIFAKEFEVLGFDVRWIPLKEVNRATAQGDIRFISDKQLEGAQDRMRKIVAQSLQGTTAEISFSPGYPGMEPTEGNKKLLRIFDQVSRDLGFSAIVPFDPGKRGAADISFVAKYVNGLDGLGAMGEGGHSPKEDIDLEAMPVLLQRAAILIYRLTNTSIPKE